MGVGILAFGFCLLTVTVSGGEVPSEALSGRSPIIPTCKANEEYQRCGCLKTCCNGGKPQGCAAQCTAGCFCKDGLVRNKNGDCIPLKDCNKTSGPPTTCGADEEYYTCVPNCHNTCETYNLTNIACPEYCRSGCFCKKGWVKRNDGKCVPTSQCITPPTNVCPLGEEYKVCGTACPRTCANLKYQIRCTNQCVKGCFCKEGLVRNKNNVCVDPEKCPNEPPVCGKDEQYYEDCAPSCTGTCEAYNNKGIYNCPLCRPGCWCKKGLVKNKDGKCVPHSKCDNPPEQCGANEEFKECGTTCPVTCSNLGRRTQACKKDCVRGCFCLKGFIKNHEGECVDPSECPPQECGQNEEYDSCGSACPKTCENKDKNIFCSLQCVPGCFCTNGFVMNAQGKCIDPSQCNITEQCGLNEEYKTCGSACPPKCSDRGKGQICTQQCVKGCFCKRGYIKNDNGICVKPSECQTNQCGVDEVYEECGTACPRTCASLYTKIRCIEKCTPGCFCKDDLVRHNGKCIDISECQTHQCGANEEYKKCGTACPETCSNLGKPQVCTDECVAGCFCKEGFVRSDNGECVKLSQCPSKQCGAGEVYQECGTACPRTCRNMHYQIKCIAKCVEGCFCTEGLVRNDAGECVEPRKCPSGNS